RHRARYRQVVAVTDAPVQGHGGCTCKEADIVAHIAGATCAPVSGNAKAEYVDAIEDAGLVQGNHVDVITALGQCLGVTLDSTVVNIGRVRNYQRTCHSSLLTSPVLLRSGAGSRHGHSRVQSGAGRLP